MKSKGRPANPTPRITRKGNFLLLNSAAEKILSAKFFDVRRVAGGIELRPAPEDIGRHRRSKHAIPIGKMEYGIEPGEVLTAAVYGADNAITFVKVKSPV